MLLWNSENFLFEARRRVHPHVIQLSLLWRCTQYIYLVKSSWIGTSCLLMGWGAKASFCTRVITCCIRILFYVCWFGPYLLNVGNSPHIFAASPDKTKFQDNKNSRDRVTRHWLGEKSSRMMPRLRSSDYTNFKVYRTWPRDQCYQTFSAKSWKPEISPKIWSIFWSIKNKKIHQKLEKSIVL